MIWLRRHRPSRPMLRARRHRWVALMLVAFLLGLQAVIGTAAAAAGPFDDCKQAPPIEVTGAGMVGLLDPALGNGPAGSLYLDYSYAGFVWHTYDTPRAWPCVDPVATITTWVGNLLFDGGKVIVGAVNGLHYQQRTATGLPGRLDDIVRKGSAVLYTGAAIPYLGLALVLVAVAIFLHALRGSLATTAKAVTRVLIGLAVMSATYLSPLLYTRVLDGLLISGVTELEDNLYTHAAPDLGGDPIVRDLLPDLLHRHVVVDNWARGEFGPIDTPYAQETIRRLVDTQACTWEEVRQGTCPSRVQGKQEEFTRIAEEIRGGKADYPTFQGTNSARIGAGFFALVEGLCFGLFQLVCKIGILLGQIVLRGAVLIGPMLGLLSFAPGVARTVFRAIAGIVVQAVILSAAATTHTVVMVWILDSPLDPMAALLLMMIITVLGWVLLKPVRRLRNMAAGAVGIPPISHDHWRLERSLRRWRRHHRYRRGRGWRQHAQPQQGAPDELLRWRSWTNWTSYTDAAPRPETADPVVHMPSRRVYTPAPYRRAELDPARPESPPRTPPSPGPPRPPVGPDPRRPRDPDDPRRPRPGHSGSTAPDPGAGGSRAESRSTAPAAHDLVVRAPGGTTTPVEGEMIVPSEMEQRDRRRPRSESQTDPPVTEPATSGGPTVYRIYRPSTHRVEPDPPPAAAPAAETTPQRPEASDPAGLALDSTVDGRPSITKPLTSQGNPEAGTGTDRVAGTGSSH